MFVWLCGFVVFKCSIFKLENKQKTKTKTTKSRCLFKEERQGKGKKCAKEIFKPWIVDSKGNSSTKLHFFINTKCIYCAVFHLFGKLSEPTSGLFRPYNVYKSHSRTQINKKSNISCAMNNAKMFCKFILINGVFFLKIITWSYEYVADRAKGFTEPAVFSCRLCFLRAFPFIILI